ncbi:MAG: ABC transporter ATP-binding protein/permease [Gammaproteobacteria bacterium]|nr:ABC transporter ATP-binding protein/permease [Gammaproteobacteria bacterium]
MSDELPHTIGAFVWRYLRSEKRYLAGFMLVALVWAAEMSLSPYLLKVIIDTVVLEAHNTEKLFHVIIMPIVLYASMSLVLNLNFRFYNYINLRLIPKVNATIHQDVFAYSLKHSYSFFQDHFVGSLTRKIVDLVVNTEALISIPNEWFISRTLAALVASVTLFKVVHPIFGVILLGWGILFVALSYLFSKPAEALSKKSAEAFSKLDGATSDAFSNVLSVKLFDNIKYQVAYVTKKLSVLVQCDRDFQWYSLKTHLILGLGLTILMVSMLTALLYGLKHAFVSAGDFALVLMLSSAFTGAVYSLGEQMQRFSKVKGTCNQALKLLTMPHEITDAPDAKKLCVEHGAIQFKDVSFAYEGQTPIFKDLNIQINPGEKVGLVGYSGAGKSTFIKLILRLLDINAGQILVDDQAVKEVTKGSLRRQIGTIPQEPELFHQSILENIKFARPEASDDEVIEAAKKARCHDFIMSLPKQYQALVGERGVKLSGGQKQRMAIARAFLKNAPILLLDEATSSLDSMTERDIHAALHQIMEHKTTLVIAHRLSTLKDMDRILVFVDGEIREDGSLAALLGDKSSIFYTLWQMQSDGFITTDAAD